MQRQKTLSRVRNSMNRVRRELAITFSTQSSPILTIARLNEMESLSTINGNLRTTLQAV